MSVPARPSPFAGTWYPDDPTELRRLVGGLLAHAPAEALEGVLSGLVAPHAGLVYSGPIAAAGYRLLEHEAFETVVLLGPSHRVFFDALAVYAEGAFETPLGTVEVDAELARAIVAEVPEARSMPEVHVNEHCLEMQLPFLQTVLPRCRIVPIMMGNQSRRHVAAAARALSAPLQARDGSVLLVASSDLSHYESRERARALDSEVVQCLADFDVEALRRLLDEDARHACGGGPILSVMAASRAGGATEARVLDYGDSGDVSGDTAAVVGYVSAAFYRSSPSP